MQTFSEWVQEIDPQLAEVLGSILSASGAFEEKDKKGPSTQGVFMKARSQ